MQPRPDGSDLLCQNATLQLWGIRGWVNKCLQLQGMPGDGSLLTTGCGGTQAPSFRTAFHMMLFPMKQHYRYRLCPHPQQEVALAKAFGCAPVVYNDALAKSRELHKKGQKTSGSELMQFYITQARWTPERPWLLSPSNVVLQQSVRDLEQALHNWWVSLRGPQGREGESSTIQEMPRCPVHPLDICMPALKKGRFYSGSKDSLPCRSSGAGHCPRRPAAPPLWWRWSQHPCPGMIGLSPSTWT